MKSFKIPRHFYISSRRWRVRFENQLTPREWRDWDGPITGKAYASPGQRAGMCLAKRRLIILALGMSAKETRRVFIHEVAHALLGEGISCGGPVLAPEVEEALVLSIESTMLSFIGQMIKKAAK